MDANHAIEAGGDGEEFDGVESDEEGGMDEESEVTINNFVYHI